jgi:hypothetical protein
MATTPVNGPAHRPSANAPSGSGGHDVTAEERRAAKHRRERLHRALLELEEALTAPTNLEGWLPRVRAAVGDMRETVLDHVTESESPDGLLAQIAEVSPWLGPRVVQLRDEHDDLVAAAETLVEASAAATTADDIADSAWELLASVSRHRRRGADLLYDAYALDVSAGD